jgi:Type II secretion system (T2SS), protein E, N-terminal domain
MGFFGGKKAKVKEQDREAPDQTSRTNKSRRIVPASRSASGGGPASAPAPAPKSDSRGAAVVRGGPARPTGKAGTDSGRVQEQRDQSASQAGSRQAPLEIDGGIKPPVRPKSREPISLGQSEPPKFAGALNIGNARKGGPCRTGDDALMDFLQNKASLIDGGQAGSVRAKAEQEALPIDVAAVQLGFITEDQMVNALTQECWVPHLKVDKYEIRKKALDTIAREDAMHYGVFPVDKLGSLLTLAMVNPLDAETIRVLEGKTSLDIKKVVATRSEITQGIEKYYSGQIQVAEVSRSFTQDIEPKSVTQMMSKVAAPPTTPSQSPPSRSLPVVHQPPPAPAPADNIVPEIQDIDDLLSSDEAIAPAIIEPISLKADAEIVPMEPVHTPQVVEAIEAPPLVTPPRLEVAPPPMQAGDLSFEEAPASEVPQQSLTRKVQPTAPAKAPVPAPEFEFADAPISAPISAPPKRAAPAPTPSAPPTPAAPPRAPAPTPAARPAEPAAKATGTASQAKGPSATSRFVGTGRTEKSGVVNLIPVMEEEFQHAITHGKSHVFEKWIGLQSRNRIINAQLVDNEMETLLAGLYASPRQV